MVDNWWMVAGGWWLVAGGWWLVASGWWLVAGGLLVIANYQLPISACILASRRSIKLSTLSPTSAKHSGGGGVALY